MRSLKQHGTSLIEVLVALFVLAIGILGMLAMQTKSMQFNQSAYAYSQAVFLANDLAERIRTNPQQAVAYVVADEATVAETVCDTPDSDCTPQQLVNYDLYHWKDSVEQTLPLGQGSVESVAQGGRDFLRITVAFDDSRSELRQDDNLPEQPETQRYVLMVEI